MYSLIIKIIPKKIRNHLYNLLTSSKIKANKEKFLGFILTFNFGLSLGLSLIISKLLHFTFFITFLLTLIIINIGIYFILSLKADATAKFVENILPDAL